MDWFLLKDCQIPRLGRSGEKLQKRVTTFHMQVSGRWGKVTLGAGLLGENPGFPEAGRGYRGHGGRHLQNQLGVEERS
jgi:hypothetical protein